jgi:hypothetical protein
MMKPLCVLFVFGPLTWLDTAMQKRKVSGEELFDDLSTRNVWFTAKTASVIPGTEALFYLKGRGVVAAATIADSSGKEQRDNILLHKYGLADYFQRRFTLDNVRRFPKPIDIRPLIPQLDFISNKGSHWGTSLRATPRRISSADYKRIVCFSAPHHAAQRALGTVRSTD